MYQWSKLKNQTLPSIADALKAVQMAEAVKDADPRPLMATLARLPVADMKLLGLQISVIDDVLGYDVDVVPEEEFSDNTSVETLANEAKERLMASGLPDYFDVILLAEMFGVSGIRAVWERDFDGKKIPNLEPISNVLLQYAKGTNSPTFFLLNETGAVQPTEITEKERDGYILARWNPFAAIDHYYVGGINRTALWLVLLKHYNWQDWGSFNERYGDPMLLGKYKRGTEEKEKSAAWQMLDELGKHSRALVSEDVTIEVVKAMVEGSITSFEKLVDKVDAALAVLYTGATLSTDVQDKGTYGAARVHLTKEEKRTWRRLKFIEKVVNEQFLRVDYRLNVKKSDGQQPMPYKFKFVTEESVDFLKNAQTVSEIQAAGYTIESDEEVSEKVGFNVKRDNAQPVSPGNLPPDDIVPE